MERRASFAPIIDDQLALTETDPRTFDPSRVLVPGNSRFRIGAAAFAEILEILRDAARAAPPPTATAASPACSSASAPRPCPPPADPAASWNRFVFADPVREYLLHDLDGAGAQLLRSRTLRREIAAERSWSELFEEFAEVTRCVRRAETVHLLRSALDFKTRSLDHQETRERYLEGRLFRFGPTEAVQSGVRTTTILFADIRGFTRASEGAVSEGDLARELYEIFDPAALIVQRFGGTVDKYLGDGFMATFTGGSRPGEEALAAVRTAISLQQVLGRMRLLGRTAFRMGISLHTGRVAVARFLIDEQNASTTIIGRQVNIAGRLSASEGDLAAARATPGARVVGDVAIDGAGRLVNHGIAVSGALLEALRRQVAFEPFSEDGIEGVRWYDPDLCLWLHFGYVGEARFRGLEATVPVYSLGYARPGAGGDGGRGERPGRPSRAARRAGVVACLGLTNVGKSTLINRLIGQKLVIVSPKPQTTSRRLRGIVNAPGGQFVIVDTPGLHAAEKAINRGLLARGAARDRRRRRDPRRHRPDRAPSTPPRTPCCASWSAKSRLPAVLAVNKIDLLAPPPRRAGSSSGSARRAPGRRWSASRRAPGATWRRWSTRCSPCFPSASPGTPRRSSATSRSASSSPR